MTKAAIGELQETATAEGLLQVLRRENASEIDRTHQVFCNRDLNLKKVESIGFDMDYTLAPYIQKEMDALSVRLTLERLVRERGYPKEILGIEPRPDFAIRGLVVDKQEGNIIKMDAHRHVGKVYHGFTALPDEERHRYRNDAIRLNTDARFALIDTLYALPEAFLFAALVDYLETTQGVGGHDWRRLFADIRYCIDLAHRDGSIKTAIIEDTPRYIERGQELAVTLHKFRSAGKQLFLLTNSYARYSDHVMGYLLDGVLAEYPRWENYFDVIITGACKPGFFTDRAPFLVVDTDGVVQSEEYAGFERGVIYQGGNLVDFERMAGVGGERVCYIGDHIYGDIVRSKKSSAWRTVMLVQEMELELARSAGLREDIAQVGELDAELQRLSEEIAYDQSLAYRLDALIESGDAAASAAPAEPDGAEVDGDGVLSTAELIAARRQLTHARDRMRRRRRELLAQLEEAEARIEQMFNPYWGLIFKLGNENTLFGEQVEDYACLYTSRVSNFINYSPMHYFRAPRQLMPHER